MLVIQPTALANLVTVNPMRLVVAHIKKRLIGRQRDAFGITQAGVHHLFLAAWLDQPHIAGLDRVVEWRFRDVDVAPMRYHDISAANACGDDRRLNGSIVRDDFLISTAHRIETPIWS